MCRSPPMRSFSNARILKSRNPFDIWLVLVRSRYLLFSPPSARLRQTKRTDRKALSHMGGMGASLYHSFLAVGV